MKLTKIAATLFGLLSIISWVPSLGAQQAEFEEASVKPSDGCRPHTSIDPGRVLLDRVPLKPVLMEAFGVNADQIIGPSWLDRDCFSIAAKIPDGVMRDQLPVMFQSLLAKRFKLVAHKEARLRGGYVLLTDKGGARFKESDPTSAAAIPRGQVTFGFAPSAGGFKGSTTMAFLARYLATQLGSPVQDLTGLTGTYDLEVAWDAESQKDKARQVGDAPGGLSGQSVKDTIPEAGASVFTALRESLGLKLESRKVQFDVLVIDGIERIPTEN